MANRIITINRMYGSNGRLIGKALAERLDIPFYDKELITLASQENDIPLEELRKAQKHCLLTDILISDRADSAFLFC